VLTSIRANTTKITAYAESLTIIFTVFTVYIRYLQSSGKLVTRCPHVLHQFATGSRSQESLEVSQFLNTFIQFTPSIIRHSHSLSVYFLYLSTAARTSNQHSVTGVDQSPPLLLLLLADDRRPRVFDSPRHSLPVLVKIPPGILGSVRLSK